MELRMVSVLDFSTPHVLRNAKEYKAAAAEIDRLLDADAEGNDTRRPDQLMGGKPRVSEFFAGKRSLSVAQIRALREGLGIPADLLIGYRRAVR
jgi:antitoxin component HigA of HigAB toxin-antitoxin module